MMSPSFRKEYTLSLGDYNLALGRSTAVMGILNVTPDSFSRDGLLNQKNTVDAAVKIARRMVREGADILDIGGESSRPGAKKVPLKDELKRVVPIIKAIIKKVEVPLSVDTYKADVARAALDEGVRIINNIKGCQLSLALLKQVIRYDATLVLMHMQGTPSTMQKKVAYSNVVDDVFDELQKTIAYCLDAGLKKDRIIIDPGLGFGKTVDHNLSLVQNLYRFEQLDCPVLLGASRKSFIGHILDCPVERRLTGSLAVGAAAVMGGAHILRVHDVKETRQTVDMIDAIINI